MTGKAYWNLLEKTAARVDTWPEWKIGRKTIRKICRCNEPLYISLQPGDKFSFNCQVHGAVTIYGKGEYLF